MIIIKLCFIKYFMMILYGFAEYKLNIYYVSEKNAIKNKLVIIVRLKWYSSIIEKVVETFEVHFI